MTERSHLQELVFTFLRGRFKTGLTVVERDQGDYNYADAFTPPTGRPVAEWSIEKTGQPSAKTNSASTSNIYFNIDDANRRAVVVLKGGMLTGWGYIIDGATEIARPVWRS